MTSVEPGGTVTDDDRQGIQQGTVGRARTRSDLSPLPFARRRAQPGHAVRPAHNVGLNRSTLIGMASQPETHNEVSGPDISGPVVQANTVTGGIHHEGTQHAHASGEAEIHQSGRDQYHIRGGLERRDKPAWRRGWKSPTSKE